MTKLEKYLTEVKARVAAATPGPWEVFEKCMGCYLKERTESQLAYRKR